MSPLFAQVDEGTRRNTTTSSDRLDRGRFVPMLAEAGDVSRLDFGRRVSPGQPGQRQPLVRAFSTQFNAARGSMDHPSIRLAMEMQSSVVTA
jgi:hypothetical protein